VNDFFPLKLSGVQRAIIVDFDYISQTVRN
jgi:hypothetical protein